MEYFDGLKEIHCQRNLISELDLSKNVKLTKLNASHNQISNIILPKPCELHTLYLEHNRLAELDARQSKKLRILDVSNNPIWDIKLDPDQIIVMLFLNHTNVLLSDIQNLLPGGSMNFISFKGNKVHENDEGMINTLLKNDIMVRHETFGTSSRIHVITETEVEVLKTD